MAQKINERRPYLADALEVLARHREYKEAEETRWHIVGAIGTTFYLGCQEEREDDGSEDQ